MNNLIHEQLNPQEFFPTLEYKNLLPSMSERMKQNLVSSMLLISYFSFLQGQMMVFLRVVIIVCVALFPMVFGAVSPEIYKANPHRTLTINSANPPQTHAIIPANPHKSLTISTLTLETSSSEYNAPDVEESVLEISLSNEPDADDFTTDQEISLTDEPDQEDLPLDQDIDMTSFLVALFDGL